MKFLGFETFPLKHGPNDGVIYLVTFSMVQERHQLKFKCKIYDSRKLNYHV